MLRILHPKLHRSLHELDGLGGGAAGARAAVRWALASRGTGPLRSRMGRWIVTLVATLAAACLAFVTLVVWTAHEHLRDPGYTAQEAWEDFTDTFDLADDWGYVLTVTLPVVLVFGVTRRLMNRSAVRRVLRRRGLCDWCGYSLAGLPVNGGGVVCPECSRVSGVAGALGEPGAGAFVPNSGLRPARFWTRRRVTRVAVAFGSVATVVGSVWGVKWWLRDREVKADAALAKADLVTLKQYRDLVPLLPTPEGAPSVFDLIATIKKELRSVEDAVRVENGGDRDSVFDPSYTIKGEYTETPENARDERFSRRVLDKWLAEGGRARLAELAGPLDYTFSPIADADGVISDFNTLGLAAARQTMRLCRAMESRAWEAKDPAAWAAAARGHIACGRSADQSKTMIGRLVAAAIESSLLSDIRARLFDLRSRRVGDAGAAEWLDVFEAAVVELASVSAPLAQALEGERLFMRHELAKPFIDVAGIKDGSTEKKSKAGSFFSGPIEGRLGRYVENRDAMNRVFDQMIATARQRPGDRTLHKDTSPTGLLMVDTFKPAADRFLLSNDQSAQLRIAVATMIALERARLTGGAYPEQLEGLRLDQAIGAPKDLFGRGTLLAYRRAAHPDGGAWYLLYSVGLDGEDNGGAATNYTVGDAFTRGVLGKQRDAVYSSPESK